MTDSESGAVSQDEIANQFSLPERQSKINTLIKAMEDEDSVGEERRYCICRSTDGTRFMIGCDMCEEWYHGNCIGITKDASKLIKKYFCKSCRARDPSLQIKFKKKKFKEKTLMQDVEKPETASEKKQKKSSRRCGQCKACHCKEDCGDCDFCKDMKKFGGQNKIRQKCRYRQCLNLGLVSMLTKSAGNSLEDSSTLTDSEINEYLSANSSLDMEQIVSNFSAKVKEKRQGSADYMPSSSKKNKSGTGKKDKKQRKKIASNNGSKGVNKHRHTDTSMDRSHEKEDYIPQQCYGPGCIQANRQGSKYCSDECGMKLAQRRIVEFLPQRIQQWNASPCVAEERNKKSLEGIRKQQIEARQKLLELDLKHKALDKIVEKGKNVTISQDQDTGDTDEADVTEFGYYCVTCGSEITAKGALRHMEKCFAKYESQTSFGSIFKTRIEGNSMFCDFYNLQHKTYCKRLKVLCPDHAKEPKVGGHEVCGCPILNDDFEETTEICRAAKRKCNKHYCWEKLRRAEIDMERVRQWQKIEELVEQERIIKVAMSNRAGVVGLMLHQTIDHEPHRPMKVPEPVT